MEYDVKQPLMLKGRRKRVSPRLQRRAIAVIEFLIKFSGGACIQRERKRESKRVKMRGRERKKEGMSKMLLMKELLRPHVRPCVRSSERLRVLRYRKNFLYRQRLKGTLPARISLFLPRSASDRCSESRAKNRLRLSSPKSISRHSGASRNARRTIARIEGRISRYRGDRNCENAAAYFSYCIFNVDTRDCTILIPFVRGHVQYIGYIMLADYHVYRRT